MQLRYDHLIGLEFKHGEQDCYELLRSFYHDNFSIDLPAYARPDNWWDKGLSLYTENAFDEGFLPLHVHPKDWRPGDVILMAVRSKVGNHIAVLVENGRILHHFYGRRSVVESYKGLWRNTTVGVFRHRDVNYQVLEETRDLVDLLPPHVRRKLGGG